MLEIRTNLHKTKHMLRSINQVWHDGQGDTDALHRARLPAMEQDGQPEPVGGAPAARLDGAGSGPTEEDPAESEVKRDGNLAAL